MLHWLSSWVDFSVRRCTGDKKRMQPVPDLIPSFLPLRVYKARRLILCNNSLRLEQKNCVFIYFLGRNDRELKSWRTGNNKILKETSALFNQNKSLCFSRSLARLLWRCRRKQTTDSFEKHPSTKLLSRSPERRSAHFLPSSSSFGFVWFFRLFFPTRLSSCPSAQFW